MADGYWTLDQQNEVKFVLDDVSGNEVAGLGTAWVINVSPPGNNAFAVGVGTKAELSNGWYYYLSTAAEADALGDVALYITHGSIRQQNLVYTVEAHAGIAVIHPYVIVDVVSDPIQGVDVIFYSDIGMTRAVWRGVTDTFGASRDTSGNQPFLDAGTYYVWRQKTGFEFSNPDTEVVT